jgi:hypothetical protein
MGRPPAYDDLGRIAALAAEYADLPLGFSDASVVALAERLDVVSVITLDRRHFGAVRPRHRSSFTLLPSARSELRIPGQGESAKRNSMG